MQHCPQWQTMVELEIMHRIHNSLTMIIAQCTQITAQCTMQLAQHITIQDWIVNRNCKQCSQIISQTLVKKWQIWSTLVWIEYTMGVIRASCRILRKRCQRAIGPTHPQDLCQPQTLPWQLQAQWQDSPQHCHDRLDPSFFFVILIFNLYQRMMKTAGVIITTPQPHISVSPPLILAPTFFCLFLAPLPSPPPPSPAPAYLHPSHPCCSVFFRPFFPPSSSRHRKLAAPTSAWHCNPRPENLSSCQTKIHKQKIVLDSTFSASPLTCNYQCKVITMP